MGKTRLGGRNILLSESFIVPVEESRGRNTPETADARAGDLGRGEHLIDGVYVNIEKYRHLGGAEVCFLGKIDHGLKIDQSKKNGKRENQRRDRGASELRGVVADRFEMRLHRGDIGSLDNNVFGAVHPNRQRDLSV